MNDNTLLKKTSIHQPDFQVLFESVPGLYLILLPDFTMVGVSDDYLFATIKTRDQIIGHNLFEVFPDNPLDIAARGMDNLRVSLNHVLKHGVSHLMDIQKYDMRRPEGHLEERYWSLLNKPVFNANNEIIYIIHQVKDVTRQVQADLKVKAGEELISLIIDNVKEYALFMIDQHGHVSSWNKGAEHINGYKAAEIIGKNVSIFYPEDEIRNGLPENNLRLASELGRLEVEGWRKRKDGSQFWAEVVYTALYDEDKILRGFSKITRDITERNLAKEQIKELNATLEQRVIERSQQLYESEKKYHNLFENNPMPMWVIDVSTFQFLDVNDAAIKHYGYSREEFLSMTSLDIRPEEERERYIQVNRAGDVGPLNVGIWKHIKKDGTLIYIEGIVHYIMFEGKLARLVLSNDVTERKIAEDRLQLSENHFRSIIEQFPYPVVSYEPNGNYTTANHAWEIMWDMKRGVPKGYNIRLDINLVALGLSPTIERAFAGEVAISEPFLYDPIAAGHEGKKRWIQLTLYPLKKPDGTLQEVIAVLQDVTENKAAEEKIQASEVRFRSLIENNNDMMTLVLPDGKLLYASPSLSKVLGFSLHELFKIPSFDLVHPDDRAGFQEQVQMILESPGKSFYRQQRLKHRNGNWIWTEGTITNMLHEGSVGALVSNFREITERKNAELHRNKITADLIQRNKDLEQFAYILSHNLRLPVANILGLSQALQDNALDEKDIPEIAKGLYHSTQKLDEVILDLNNILKVRSEIIEKKEIVRFSELVSDIRNSLDGQIKKDHVEFKVDFSEVDEMLTLKSYLHSVFYNLISNSIKYRKPNETCIIEINTQKTASGIQLTIRDNGVGMNLSKMKNNLFGLYKRFHPEVEGKGVGLFMVKTQVEALGGTIHVKSESNQGTEFIIDFELTY